MLHSMTGFARVESESALGTVSWELRSVNHRYLDVQFRLPDALRGSEPALRTRAGARLGRGKVDCTLSLRPADEQQGELPIDRARLEQLRDALAMAADVCPEANPASAMDLLRWPGVITERQVDSDALATLAAGLFDEALSELVAMRAREGERLAALLLDRCDDIDALTAAVRTRRPQVLAAIRTRMKDRLATLDVDADPARLETELAIIAQKLDVDEELDRLDAHIAEIRTVLESTEPVGRRLDFLMQELNREANTLGSKSADAETTRAAVDLKVAIEQMREQIQNVE